MGARCAPSYANLFLGWWEELHVYPSSPFQQHVIGWHRFIDDILFFWTGTLDECQQFIEHLNVNPWHICLTSHLSLLSADFLDLRIRVDNGRILTTLFRKQTATNSLLHYGSFHPQHVRDGIPIGQFLRIRRNCTSKQDFQEHSRDLTTRLKNRGYPKKVISHAYQRARDANRSSLLETHVTTTSDIPKLIVTYNNQWDEIRHLLKRHWNILLSDERLASHIPPNPPLVARRAKNLKDNLSHSHFQRHRGSTGRGIKIRGTYPCGNCSVCPLIQTGETFHDPLSGVEYKLHHYINCKTRNVVYALRCPCNKLYIGQTTQELRKRVQQHLSTISNADTHFGQDKPLSTVAAHYRMCHKGKTHGTKVMGLELIRKNPRGGNTTLALLRSEARWIFKLDCQAPKGLNEDLLFTGFYKQ
ncbi:uncharacterized protein [Engystomops pustulosus]|uniref:uncharacterized protein n=1 Tax=Engystomops pustulosus TaxID=76066 RepID=UPI003AFB31B3